MCACAQHRVCVCVLHVCPLALEVWDESEADDPEVEAALGKYAIEGCRIDLLPTVAMDRLGLHNELCSLKWAEPAKWMREVKSLRLWPARPREGSLEADTSAAAEWRETCEVCPRSAPPP